MLACLLPLPVAADAPPALSTTLSSTAATQVKLGAGIFYGATPSYTVLGTTAAYVYDEAGTSHTPTSTSFGIQNISANGAFLTVPIPTGTNGFAGVFAAATTAGIIFSAEL